MEHEVAYQPVGIRVIERIVEKLAPSDRTILCRVLHDVESNLLHEATVALTRKDYNAAARLSDELVFLNRAKIDICGPGR